jgi:hypothetical protein
MHMMMQANTKLNMLIAAAEAREHIIMKEPQPGGAPCVTQAPTKYELGSKCTFEQFESM